MIYDHDATQTRYNALGAYAAKGLRQFRVAETEKYLCDVWVSANSGIRDQVGEDRYMAPSVKKSCHYDLQPEM
jgi:2,3-bisphosphoglycerate-independent phosphoglycerate mutase